MSRTKPMARKAAPQRVPHRAWAWAAHGDYDGCCVCVCMCETFYCVVQAQFSVCLDMHETVVGFYDKSFL